MERVQSARVLRVTPEGLPLRLEAGERLQCQRGTVWLTHDCRDAALTREDHVLQAGQSIVAPARACFVASALGRGPARLGIAPARPAIPGPPNA